MLTAYTDYPLFPDEYGKEAPIREVSLLSFDGNKYVTVGFEGKEYSIKYGYLYREPGRSGEVPYIPVEEFEELPLTLFEDVDAEPTYTTDEPHVSVGGYMVCQTCPKCGQVVDSDTIVVSEHADTLTITAECNVCGTVQPDNM